MFLYLLAILFCFFIYLTVIKPLYPMLKLKLQFGKDCHFNYHFLGAEMFQVLKDLKTSGDMQQRARERHKKHPFKIMVSNFLWRTRIVIADPEYQKTMLLNHQYYTKVNNINHNDLITQGLVFTMGEKWKNQRSLLGGPFEYEQLKSRLPMMNEIVIEKLNQFEGENVLELMELITGQVVIRSFFGQSAQGIKINGKEIQIEIADLLNDMGALRFSSKLLFFKRFFLGTNSWKFFPSKKEREILSRISETRLTIEKLIQKRIVQQELKIDENENAIENKQQDFLDVQIQEYLKQKKEGKNLITIEEIIQQFITLFFAGTDTTALLSYHCLYFFAKYPEVQEEIRQEINEICQDETITEKQLPKLIKLNAFIQEVLRVRNPALRLLMRTCNQTHYVQDLKIEKGWNIISDLSLLNNSENHFDQAEEFNYQRWINNDPIKNNNNFIYIPFSAGPRNCIGQHMAKMEAKIILSKILQQYNVILNQGVKCRWIVKFLYQLSPENAIKLIKNNQQ